MKKILVASHVSEVYAPTYPLLRFLEEAAGYEVIKILHPFKTRFVGLHFVKDFCVTAILSFYHRGNYDVYIGVSSLDVLPGIMVKLFDRSKIVIYYSADYSRSRFGNFLWDRLYVGLDEFCSRHADYNWSVSERIRDVKRSFAVREERNILVPNGAHLSRVRPFKPLAGKVSNSLFYVGHLTPEKGVQDILAALKSLAAYRLFIIGNGPYCRELKNQAAELKIIDRVYFLGEMSNEDVLQKIREFEIGLAPYTSLKDYVYFCDPVKIKEYLAVGCPVIVSRVVEIASEIERQNCGIAATNFAEELPGAVEQVKGDYSQMSNNARAFAARFDWNDIYKRAFNEM